MTQKIIKNLYICDMACCKCECGENVVIGETNDKINKELICKKIRYEECKCGNIFLRELKWQ